MRPHFPLVLCSLCVLPPCSVPAQVVADPGALKGQRPTVMQSANGVIQVNVQTPSAAGVSHNTYQRFDIERRGVILNNSRTDTTTELAGWIQGNPWLARGSARILLNEVKGPDASRLAGRLEVAGGRAEVVIANPAGITCSGCGFINASRATMVTGVPVMQGGALQAFRVKGGVIEIQGTGLDARETDQAALLTRALRVNAAIHADRLAVVAGAGEVPAGPLLAPGLSITPVTPAGPAPRLLMDVSALGGLYANKIFLVGTETGMGMAHAGRMVATEALVLRSDGWLTQSGRVEAGRELIVKTQSLDNRHGVMRAPRIDLSAPAGALLNDAGVIAATDQLGIRTASVDNVSGVILADVDLQIATTGPVRNGAGLMAAGRQMQIDASDLSVEKGGSLWSDATLQIRVDSSLSNAGEVGAGEALSACARQIDNAQGGSLVGFRTRLQAVESLTNRGLVDGAFNLIESDSVLNIGTGRLYGDVLAIGARSLTNDTETQAGGRADAVIAARERLDIGVRQLVNREHARILSAGKGEDALTVAGELDAGHRAIGQAESVINSSATIESQGGLRLAAQRLENQNAHFETHVVQTLAPTPRLYIQPEGRARLPGELFVWEGWSRAGRYRYRTDPLAGSGSVLGQSPIPRVGEQSCTGDEDQEVCTRLPGADYLPGDPAWAYFGLRTPEPEPLPPTVRAPVAPDAARAGACAAGATQDAVACRAYQDDLAAYETARSAYAQAWAEHEARQAAWRSETDARYAQLDDRIEAYNAGFAGSLVQNWTQYHVTRTERETQVLTSDPGRILSGGSMHLAGGDLVNDKSQIVAGGVLAGELADLRNLDAEGVRIVSESGTSQYTASRWRGGFKRYHQRDWSGLAPYVPADEVTPIVLPVAQRRSQAGASAATGLSAPSGQWAVSETNTAGTTGSRVRTLAVSGPWPLPTSSLFRPAADDTAPYWIETDPRFTQRLKWQQQSGPDPSQLGKRLGDAFFEQQLVRDQVLELTGRRFLAGHGSDEAQYQALMQAGEFYARTHSLKPGIALSASQMAQLTTDIVWMVLAPVTLPDGRTVQALVPRLYAVVRPGDPQEGGALMAGDSVNLRLSGDLWQTGMMAGRRALVIDAQNIRNLGGRMSAQDVTVQARESMESLGGVIRAERSLSLHAGQDLSVAATMRSQQAREGQSSGERTQVERMAGLYVTNPDGVLLTSAERDLVLRSAQIMNGPVQGARAEGATLLLAGRDLRLEAVEVKNETRTVWDDQNFELVARRHDVGTQIQVQGELLMSAGRDLGVQAARVESVAGAVVLQAGRDAAIAAGSAQDRSDAARHWMQRGLFSSRSLSTRDTVDETRAVAATISGESVRIVAGRDASVQGSQVVSTQATSLAAGRDVVVEAASQSRTENHERHETRRGVFSSGGLGITIGKRDVRSTQERVQETLAPSTVGSAAGEVVFEAGEAYRQTASDVLAPQGDIHVSAHRVEIADGQESSRSVDRTQFAQTGVTVALTNPVVTAAQTANQMARSAAATNDPRMRALAAATTALAVRRAAQAVKAQPETAGGVGLSVSIGSVRSSGERVRSEQGTRTSEVIAGGDLSVRAEGDGQDSTLTVRGSDLQAGGDATLTAEGGIALVAAARVAQEHSTQRSEGASLGVGMAFGAKTSQSPTGWGLTASVSASRGASESATTDWRNTQVQAQGNATLDSGQAIVLRGAVVQGERVVVHATEGLFMESLQDTETYRSEQRHAAAGVTVGAGAGGSLVLGKSRIENSFASVGEQTALRAGDAGFEVSARGDAVLSGAAVTSSEAAVQAGVNQFEARSLTTEDIGNHARYEATAIGISLGVEKDLQGKLGAQGTGGGLGRDAQQARSVTPAGVSGLAGHQEVRTGDPSTGLRPIFDAEQVRRSIQAQVTITAAAGVEARKAIESYVSPRKADLQKKLKAASTPDDVLKAKEELKRLEREERVMNILVGAVTMQGGAAVAREALGEASKKMRELMIEDSLKFKGVTDGVTSLTNDSGVSAGVDGDGFKLGGARVSLELVCGEANQRCERSKETGEFILTEKQMIQFQGESDQVTSLDAFLQSKEGKKMAGVTGGVQGSKGTLYGLAYEPGSWIDTLVESFAGAHDMIGGKIVGVYDVEGNIKRNRGSVVGRMQDYWSLTGAVVVSTPFAMATLLPPDVWNAISIFLRAAR